MNRRAPDARRSLSHTLTALALACLAATPRAHAQAPTAAATPTAPSAPSAPSVPSVEATQAAAAAKASSETPEGKTFAAAIGAAFGREQPSAIQKCARETKRPDLSDFELVLKVDSAGAVREALTQSTTPLARCVATALVGWKVQPAPPGHEWVSIAVQLKPKR